MAPNKVTKNQESPKKGSNKSPSKSALSETNLLFLWYCVHNSKGKTPDFKTVAEKMQIVPGTAYYRYNQLKSYFESIGVSDVGVEKEPSCGGADEPKTPTKTPKKAKKTPKKINDDELEPPIKMEGVVIPKEEEAEHESELAVGMEDDIEI